MKKKNEDYFRIKGLGGKRKLEGSVHTSGAKNAVLKIMASSILFDDELVIKNVPLVEDVKRMQELLEDLGAKVEWRKKREIIINTKGIKKTTLNEDVATRMRASIVLSGPLLGRFGETSFPHPGGCVIGERPIDMFLDIYKSMGAVTKRGEDGIYRIKAVNGLRGQTFFFPHQSVGATETAIMTSILAKGETVLRNAALEPEVLSVAEFLKKCGAKIYGLGTTTVKIEGGKMLKARGRVYSVIPDRLEAGSFMILGALSAKDLIIKNCQPEHLNSIIDAFSRAGVKMKVGKKSIRILDNSKMKFEAFNIKTHEYPGFPTDMQAPMAIFLTQSWGESGIFETIFEDRFGYAEDLKRMGAHISLWNPQKISINGPTKLKHAILYGPDLRAGLAFIIASIIAEGESEIRNAYIVDRGYERIEEKLSEIGVEIERISK